ncbi:hypothetical protein [Undibacterium sp.]|uniref:hypothetical protein n=1 Tax=Undibacterium sp. TaxID=1914977 RepID=UPI0027322128|nr:hypothetical protein [Undibacterium sp.]MDP1977627.1 hypothetical protein [Undibacterium sp.]
MRDKNKNLSEFEIGQHAQRRILFSAGRIVATTAMASYLCEIGIETNSYLLRHLQGDWGDITPEDVIANNLAVQNGSRIFSAYVAMNRRFWIITETDRSATTLLFPEEY